MAVSDDDGTAERLAQARAQRRRLGRLRTAERRDGVHEHAADAAADRAAEQDPLTTPLPTTSEATRARLIAEQDAIALDQAGLVSDRDGGIEMDF